jgi:hypothetical protein
MLDGSLATVYTKLWYFSDDATPPVCVVRVRRHDAERRAGILRHALGDDPFPHIRVARPACPDGDELDLVGADVRELINDLRHRGCRLLPCVLPPGIDPRELALDRGLGRQRRDPLAL